MIFLFSNTLPVSSHPLGGVGDTGFNQGGDDVDDGADFHTTDHKITSILVLIDSAQTIENPNHQKHSDTVYLSLLKNTIYR